MNNTTLHNHNTVEVSNSFDFKDPKGQDEEFLSVETGSNKGDKVEDDLGDSSITEYNDHFDLMEESLW